MLVSRGAARVALAAAVLAVAVAVAVRRCAAASVRRLRAVAVVRQLVCGVTSPPRSHAQFHTAPWPLSLPLALGPWALAPPPPPQASINPNITSARLR